MDQAAAYIGICRTNFYKQLKRYPELKASSFMIGSRRYWPKDALWTASNCSRTGGQPKPIRPGARAPQGRPKTRAQRTISQGGRGSDRDG